MRWVSASRPFWLPPNIYCSSYTYILRALVPKKWHQVSSSPKSRGEMLLLWSGPHVARRGADLQLKRQVYLPWTQDLMYKGRKEPGACTCCAWVSTKILPRWSLNGAFCLELLLLPTSTATVSRQFEAASLIPFLQDHNLQSELQLRLLLGPLVHFRLRQVFPN